VVEALRYKPEGRGFDSRCCHWNFSHYGPRVDSTSNRNEYQAYFLQVKAAGACLLSQPEADVTVFFTFLVEV
jgi:hypothetical protein